MILQDQILDNNNTVLSNRTLWIDGDVSVTPEQLYLRILHGNDCCSDYVTELTDDVKKYNKYFTPFAVKTQIKPLNTSWNIPEKYYKLNLKNHLMGLLKTEALNKNIPDNEVLIRVKRIHEELQLYSAMDLTEFVLVAMFIVDTFKEHSIIWGTGRGSSCCSYILYLLGLHNVDSVKYELNIREFLR